jgi:hypothetical protein
MGSIDCPIDGVGKVMAAGSAGFSEGFDADGTWQAITVGHECKGVTIACRADDTEVYDRTLSPIEFNFSFNQDGSFFDYATRLDLSVAKNAGEVLCYVRASNGYKFTVTGIY